MSHSSAYSENRYKGRCCMNAEDWCGEWGAYPGGVWELPMIKSQQSGVRLGSRNQCCHIGSITIDAQDVPLSVLQEDDFIKRCNVIFQNLRWRFTTSEGVMTDVGPKSAIRVPMLRFACLLLAALSLSCSSNSQSPQSGGMPRALCKSVTRLPAMVIANLVKLKGGNRQLEMKSVALLLQPPAKLASVQTLADKSVESNLSMND